MSLILLSSQGLREGTLNDALNRTTDPYIKYLLLYGLLKLKIEKAHAMPNSVAIPAEHYEALFDLLKNKAPLESLQKLSQSILKKDPIYIQLAKLKLEEFGQN